MGYTRDIIKSIDHNLRADTNKGQKERNESSRERLKVRYLEREKKMKQNKRNEDTKRNEK